MHVSADSYVSMLWFLMIGNNKSELNSLGQCHEIDSPELAYPRDTLFLSPSIPHLVKSQPMDKKLQA